MRGLPGLPGRPEIVDGLSRNWYRSLGAVAGVPELSRNSALRHPSRNCHTAAARRFVGTGAWVAPKPTTSTPPGIRHRIWSRNSDRRLTAAIMTVQAGDDPGPPLLLGMATAFAILAFLSRAGRLAGGTAPERAKGHDDPGTSRRRWPVTPVLKRSSGPELLAPHWSKASPAQRSFPDPSIGVGWRHVE
jgi:hypothetical protein